MLPRKCPDRAPRDAISGLRVLLQDVPPQQPVISDPPRVLALPQRYPELLLPLNELLQVRLAYLHLPSIGSPTSPVAAALVQRTTNHPVPMAQVPVAATPNATQRTRIADGLAAIDPYRVRVERSSRSAGSRRIARSPAFPGRVDRLAGDRLEYLGNRQAACALRTAPIRSGSLLRFRMPCRDRAVEPVGGQGRTGDVSGGPVHPRRSRDPS